MHRLGVERRCEKELLNRRRLSIALFRAPQVMRRTQADSVFKKAVDMGAPSRLQGPHLRPVLRSWRNWDQMAWTRGRRSSRWMLQRWPWEVLQVHSQRVREAASAFRKRTSCADDHLVIEMLRELDEDVWEKLAKCVQCRLLNHRNGG